MLQSLGFDCENDEGLKETPLRMAKAFEELLAGYDLDAATVLGTTFDGDGYDEVIVLRDIPFASLCEHHVLPFTGTASIAYLPGECIVGLSKLARLVDMHARRLQIQERMTKDIATDLNECLRPEGVAVVVQATHTCMTIRGVNKAGSVMVTSTMLGKCRKNAALRAEALQLLKGDL